MVSIHGKRGSIDSMQTKMDANLDSAHFLGKLKWLESCINLFLPNNDLTLDLKTTNNIVTCFCQKKANESKPP